jgi:hypothetical protein
MFKKERILPYPRIGIEARIPPIRMDPDNLPPGTEFNIDPDDREELDSTGRIRIKNREKPKKSSNERPTKSRIDVNKENNNRLGSNINLYQETRLTETQYNDVVDKMNRDGLPTVINVCFNIANGALGIKEPTVPIAIKANLSAIGTDELRMVLERGIEGSLPSLRYIKAMTGEIAVLKDWIFEIDKARNDKILYKQLGRHPWFRKLLDRKNMSKLNFLKRRFNARSILPTTTIIVTKEDLVLSTKLDFSQFLRNSKLIEKIMDSMFLLSIGVYEPDLEQVTFFYNGMNEPMVHSLLEMKKSSKDPNKDLFEALANMSRRM